MCDKLNFSRSPAQFTTFDKSQGLTEIEMSSCIAQRSHADPHLCNQAAANNAT
jgi:hypothetical protein